MGPETTSDDQDDQEDQDDVYDLGGHDMTETTEPNLWNQAFLDYGVVA